MAAGYEPLVVEFPDAPGAEETELLRESVAELARVSGGARKNLEQIEALRADALSNRFPRKASTVRVRVWYSVLCDLASQGWQLEVDTDVVLLRIAVTIDRDPIAEKERVRGGHLIERDRYLREDVVRRFVREMESIRLHKGEWTSVFSLMRDGPSLAQQLARVARSPDRATSLASLVSPYLQVADADSVCGFTGLRLLDIWRYFRLTWSTIPQSVPGRRMLVLVRDAAAPNHPVIGIAALGSPVVQLSVRDEWIRWTPQTFIHDMRARLNAESARWLLDGVNDAVGDVYRKDLVREGLISAQIIREPTREVIDALRAEARNARAAHNRYARTGKHKQATLRPDETDWRQQAKTFLFRSKRCLALAAALEVRLILNELGLRRPTGKALAKVVESAPGRRAISATLRYVKAKHAGIDMAEITVCGAVAPYSPILGGKLVALLMASPEIVTAYRNRYSASPSLIASAMKGKLVQRRPNLVFLGTTSLYGLGSSQYNRLFIPKDAVGEMLSANVRYTELGKSVGFGSYHFSKVTTDEMNVLAQQQRDGRRVNNIFGEGVSPKLRRVRDALETVGFQSNKLLRHGSPRLVYGLPLATNFRDVLVGRSRRPKYLFDLKAGQEATEAIADFWRNRWLAPRIHSPEVVSAVESHSTLRPIRHGARVSRPADELGLPLFEAND